MSASRGGATGACTSSKKKVICFAQRRGGAKSRKKERKLVLWDDFTRTVEKRGISCSVLNMGEENEVTRKDLFAHRSS